MILRDYQVEASLQVRAEIARTHSALCVLPTGAGKTEVMIDLLQYWTEKKPDIKVVILVNKLTLVRQTAKRIAKVLGNKLVGIYCASEGERDKSKSVTVASIQSIYAEVFNPLHLIIVDEVHNLDELSGRFSAFIKRHRLTNEKLKLIGFTATPFRATGSIHGKGRLFERICYQLPMINLIARGHLVPPRLKKVDHEIDTSQMRIRNGEFAQEDVAKATSDEGLVKAQISDALVRLQGREQVIWACASILHCMLVYTLLLESRESAEMVHSEMTLKEREESLGGFTNTVSRHLVFVTIVSEGFDHPPIDALVLMRPIRSPVLYVQTVGRALRPFGKKKDALVLDYGQVVKTLGPVDNPAVPKQGSGNKKLEPLSMKFCPNCLEYIPAAATECPVCEHQMPRAPVPKIMTPDQKSRVLSSDAPEIKQEEVVDVSLSYFKSKSGNDCLKISYRTKNFLNPYLFEYFVWNNDWARRSFTKRAVEMGIPLQAGLHTQVMQRPANLPLRIQFHTVDKYPKITKLVFA